MKKFAVLEKIGLFKPTVIEDFDDVKDAATYANIMRRRYPKREYSVFQLNEEL